MIPQIASGDNGAGNLGIISNTSSGTTLTVTPTAHATSSQITDPGYNLTTGITHDPSPTITPTITQDNRILVQGFVYDTGTSDICQYIPVAGATIFFINNSQDANNTTSFVAVSGAQGFYSILLQPGKYTVVAAAAGFGTRIEPEDLEDSISHDFFLIPIPLNGVVAFAQNPVLQASPGTDAICTIYVFNSQVSAETVTFTVITPDGMGAWFPQGEALNLPPGQYCPWTFAFRYTGSQCGSFPVTIRVSDGVNSFDLQVIVKVEDTPYQTIDFYANSYYREVTSGSIIRIPLTVQNNYAIGKFLKVYFDYLPDGWKVQTADYAGGLSTRTDDYYYVYKNEKYNFVLRVFIPSDNTSDGTYNIDLHMSGDGVTSNILPIIVKVNNTRLLDAQLFDADEKPIPDMSTYNVSMNNNNNTDILLKVVLTNNWGFPVAVQANKWMTSENKQTTTKWNITFFSDEFPNDKAIYIDPGMNETIYYHITPSSSVDAGISTLYLTFASTDTDTAYGVASVLRTVNINLLKPLNNTTFEKNAIKKKIEDDNNSQYAIIPPILLIFCIFLYALYHMIIKFYNRGK